MAHTVSRIITDDTLNRIITIESAGKPQAQAPTSSARGLFQFLNGTWMDTVRKHRPDWLSRRSKTQVLALRDDPELSIEMGARFTEDNAKIMGAGWTDGDIYLAHFSGAGVARKLLRTDASQPSSSCYSAAAIRANRDILEGKTVGQVRAWAAAKMKKAGGTNWIKKYWKGGSQVEATDIDIEATPVKVEAPERVAPAVVARAPAAGQDIPAPEPIYTDQSGHIAVVQQDLRALGYLEVGDVKDGGKLGSKTIGAIAAFRHDRGIPEDGGIDEVLLAEIVEAKAEFAAGTWKRPISKERSEATPEQVVEKTDKAGQAITSAGWLESIGKWFLGLPAALGVFWNAILKKVEVIKEWAGPFADEIDDIPKEYFFLGLLAVAALVILQSRSAKKSVTQSYNEGETN